MAKPKDGHYFDLFESLAQKVREAAELFSQESDPLKKAEKIKKLENEADNIVHAVADMLDLHGHPPLKRRGDILRLVHNMDNVLDCIEKASNRIVLFSLPYTEDFYALGAMLPHATHEIEAALHAFRTLRKSKKSMERIKTACIKINEIEEHGDRLYRNELLPKIEHAKRTANTIPFWHEHDRIEMIFELLERAFDQCEDVSEIMESLQKENM